MDYGERHEMVPRYHVTVDAGTVYIHKVQGIASKTTVVPLTMALMACELLICCKNLLSFIEAHDMDGRWDQEQYPTIRKAREIVKNAEDGHESLF